MAVRSGGGILVVALERKASMATSDSATTTATRDRSTGTPSHGRSSVGREAAATASARNSIPAEMPGIGQVSLPPLDQVAFLGGIATLALLSIIEWPVAAVMAVGHILAHNRHHALLRDFGEALDKA